MYIRLGEKLGKKQKLYVDGEFSCGLYASEIRQFNLEDREEISGEEYERLMKEIVLPRAKRRVLNILLKSDKTETELRRKLKENLYSEETADAVIDYVNGYHYIDELRIAQSFIRTKMYDCSEKEIRYKLEGKGVSEDIIDKAYDMIIEELNFKWREDSAEDEDTENDASGQRDNFSENEFQNPEMIAAERFLRKKIGSRYNDDGEMSSEETQKIMAAAFRKGFSMENIRKALKKICIQN